MLETILRYFYNSSCFSSKLCYFIVWVLLEKKKEFRGFLLTNTNVCLKREESSSEDWITYQTKELRKLLIHSFTNVPYYKKKYTQAGFRLADFENFHLKGFKKTPFFRKDKI